MIILNFKGAAIRRRSITELANGRLIGRTFLEATFMLNNCVPIGLVNFKDMPNYPKGDGILPDDDRVITKDDMLIFISIKTAPTLRRDVTPAKIKSYKAEADVVFEEHIKPNIGWLEDSKKILNERKKRELLICGWRKVWFEDPGRFYARLVDIGNVLSPDSKIIFVNGINDGDFEAFWRSAGMGMYPTVPFTERVYRVPNAPGVKAYHFEGDSSSVDDMDSIVQRFNIDSAVVLGSLAYADLSEYSQDTRVISTMLHLRYLSDLYGKGGIQLIGENQEDQTGMVALAPRNIDDDDGEADVDAKEGRMMIGAADTTQERDFINTQAIYARTLAHKLAFPIISPIIEDLMRDTPGASNIGLFPVYAFACTNVKLKFGVIQSLCMETRHPLECVCLGILYGNGTLALSLDIDDEVVLTVADRLVCITREFEVGGCFPMPCVIPKCPEFKPPSMDMNCKIPFMAEQPTSQK